MNTVNNRPLFPDSVVIVPKDIGRDEVEARVLSAIRDASDDGCSADGVIASAQENFLATVRPFADRSSVVRLATHWVRVFEEVG